MALCPTVLELLPVSSKIPFCVYFDELLTSLKSSKYGCYYVGALAYTDDTVLLAPTANAMRCILKLCDSFSGHYSVKFNADKSKCSICRPSGTSKLCCAYHHVEPVFHINKNRIEIVDKWPYLGHITTDCVDDNEDILSRKLSLIGQINSILCKC